jgi:hypothetical protein
MHQIQPGERERLAYIYGWGGPSKVGEPIAVGSRRAIFDYPVFACVAGAKICIVRIVDLSKR